MTERWAPLPGNADYEVSDLGRVRSLERVVHRHDGKPMRVPGRILKPYLTKRGYLRVSPAGTGPTPVHRLVAAAFVSCSSEPALMTVNHIDGDKTNNAATNLEWISASANIIHAHRIGLTNAVGSANPRAKIRESDVKLIRHLYGLGHRQVDLAARFGIDQTGISGIVLRKTWKHVV